MNRANLSYGHRAGAGHIDRVTDATETLTRIYCSNPIAATAYRAAQEGSGMNADDFADNVVIQLSIEQNNGSIACLPNATTTPVAVAKAARVVAQNGGYVSRRQAVTLEDTWAHEAADEQWSAH